MDVEKQSRQMYKIVEDAEKYAIEKVLQANLNATGLASLFLDRAMGLLDRNIQYCLNNDDPKGALDYLNVFMMDWDSKTSNIQASIKRIQDNLDGSEQEGAEVNGVIFNPRENKHR